MITFKDKLDNLIKEGSSFSDEEITFLEKEYENCIKSSNSYTYFKRSLETKIKTLMKKSSSIYHLSFLIGTQNKKYIYSEDPTNTLYDIASVTKLFTLALFCLLEKKGIISYEDKIIDTLPLQESMKDITVLDLLKMKGRIETDEKLSDMQTVEQFMHCLYTVHPVETDEKGAYTDIGFTLLRFYVEKKILEKTGKKKRYDVIMDEYLLKPFGLYHTMYQPDPSKYILLGNGNQEGKCNDKKTRVIDSINGAAGLFSTVQDMYYFMKQVLEYKIFSPSFIKSIFSYSFLDSSKRVRSYAGLYLPCTNINNAAKYYSQFTVVHQGYTGSLAVGDFKNHICNSILLNAMKEGKFEKGKSFLEEFRRIYKYISLYSVLFYILYE